MLPALMSVKDAKLLELEEKPVASLLAQYSLPAIVGMTAMSLYNLVDAVYIGQFCGSFAISAMALVFPIMNLTVAFGTLVGLGSAASASIALGQQDFDRAFRVVGHCAVLSALFGVLIGWFPLLWLDEMLELFGASPDTLQPARDFTLVMMLGFPVASTFMNFNHLMRAGGYPLKAMVSLLLSMVVNIACADLFVRVLGWGMIGAGLATVVAQLVGLAWVFAHFFNKRHVLHFKRGIYKLCGPIVRRIFFIGLPPCLLNAAGCVCIVVYNYQLRAYEGDIGMGAFGIVNRVVFTFVMVVLGITQGMQPIAGYNLGMGNFDRVRSVLFCAMAAGTAVTTLGWAAMQLFPNELAWLFADKEDVHSARLIDIAAQGVRLLVAVFPLVGSQIVIGNFFQAIGRPSLSIMLNLSRQFIILIPMLMVLPPLWGSAGIWLSQAVADVVCGVMSFIVLYFFLTRVMCKTCVTPRL